MKLRICCDSLGFGICWGTQQPESADVLLCAVLVSRCVTRLQIQPTCTTANSQHRIVQSHVHAQGKLMLSDTVLDSIKWMKAVLMFSSGHYRAGVASS